MTTTTVEAVGNNEIDVISFSAYCGLVAAYVQMLDQKKWYIPRK
jgi:hypothetical protein